MNLDHIKKLTELKTSNFGKAPGKIYIQNPGAFFNEQDRVASRRTVDRYFDLP